MIIYKATNNINGKVYIGQTIRTLQLRKKEHFRDAKKCNHSFANALNKYGEENFYWMVLNECDDINLLNRLEDYYISCYDSMNREKGYNLTSGGLNFIRSEETRKKFSEANTGEKNSMFGKHPSEETLEKMRKNRPDQSGENNPMWGKHPSKETIQKMRDNSPDRHGENHWNFGGHLSEEHKAKISESEQGRVFSKEHSRKKSEAQMGEKNHRFGKKPSSETIEKQRLARLKYWAAKKALEAN